MLEIHVNVPPQISHYKIDKVIGKGAFSVVYLAVDEKTEKNVALKVVPKDRLSSPSLQERFEVEIHIFQQLSHPGIVRLLDLSKDDSNYYIFMEYCDRGELFDHIVKNGKLKEDECRYCISEIFESLNYVHSKGVAHRDLKPENLLLNGDGHIKISDFGLSRYVLQHQMCETPCGSPCYAAPEIISGVPYDGVKADMWSMGVILFAMLTGQLPWTKRNQVQLFEQIKRGGYRVPGYLSDECQDLIKSLMNVNPNERITMDQVFKHPWMLKGSESARNKTTEIPAFLVSLKKVDEFFESGVFDDLVGLNNIGEVKNMAMSTDKMDMTSLAKSLRQSQTIFGTHHCSEGTLSKVTKTSATMQTKQLINIKKALDCQGKHSSLIIRKSAPTNPLKSKKGMLKRPLVPKTITRL